MFPLKIVIFHSYVSLPEGSPLAMVIFPGLESLAGYSGVS